MNKAIFCSLPLALVACHDIKPIQQSTKTLAVETVSRSLLPKDSYWQFDKLIYVTDENLKKLENKATVRFTRGDKNLGDVGIYSGCNAGGTVIEFDDKNFRTVKPRNQGYVGNAMGCVDYNKTENAFVGFITDGNTYDFQGEKLILTDSKGQKIQFKPYLRNNENSNAH